MRDLSPEVKAALETALPGNVYYFYPHSFSSLPVISYYDQNNAGEDGRDLLTKVAFQVDIWAKTIPQLKPLIAQTDAAMRGLGFRRSFCSPPLPDPSGLRHQSMRFEGTYNALDQKLYSRS